MTMKTWKKPIINELKANDLKQYIKAAAWSFNFGCEFAFGR